MNSRLLRLGVPWRQMGWLGVTGLAVLIAMGVLALLAPWIAAHPPNAQDYTAVLVPPSKVHPLGTDDIGRDVFSRILHGGRVSLTVGLGAVLLALCVGVSFGVVAGVGGRYVDEVLMRLMDALQSFPGLVLALTVTAVLGPSLRNTAIAIGAVSMPAFARLSRAQVLVVRELDYVHAARVQGSSTARIVFVHVLPNIAGPLVVQSTFLLAVAIMAEAALSFLGLGVLPPAPSWGAMLRDSYPYLATAPWLAVAPGAAVFVTVLGLNFAGEGLRAALDPNSGRSPA